MSVDGTDVAMSHYSPITGDTGRGIRSYAPRYRSSGIESGVPRMFPLDEAVTNYSEMSISFAECRFHRYAG